MRALGTNQLKHGYELTTFGFETTRYKMIGGMKQLDANRLGVPTSKDISK